MTDNELLLAIYEDTQDLKKRITNVENNLATVQNKVSSIEVTLENETNRNIKIIAEAYLDLTRKLDDALKVENEKEMLLIRVNHLENEVRKLKEQIKEISKTA